MAYKIKYAKRANKIYSFVHFCKNIIIRWCNLLVKS